MTNKKSLIIPFDFYVNNDKIEKDKVFVLNKLKRLLETYPSNVNTQEKLNFFLSNPDRFKIIDGKKIYRTLKGNIKTIRNQIGDFYIGNRKISKDEVFNVIELKKLLQTNFLNINTNITFDEEINGDYVNDEKYFNSINHHIIITPYIKSILWKFDSEELISIINSFDDENIWYTNQENFKFKDININSFLSKWNNELSKINNESKILFGSISQLSSAKIYTLDYNK